MKLSIIVPVYNVEGYLSRCIDSLLAQNLPSDEYEIIMVDDGSTDDSPNICDEYADKQNNVKVIHQENKGLSGARNTGLDIACGKYIMFVDSDDYLEKNCIAELVDEADSRSLEICFYDFDVVEWPNGIATHGTSNKMVIGDDVINGECYVLRGGRMGSACQMLYLHTMLERIRFVEGITHEDVAFNLDVIPFSERIGYYYGSIYYYWRIGESITRTDSIEKIQKNVKSNIIVTLKCKRVFETASKVKIGKFYRKYSNSMLLGIVLQLIKNRKLWKCGFTQECFESMKKYDLYPIKGRTLSWKTTLLIPLINCQWLIERMFRCKLD